MAALNIICMACGCRGSSGSTGTQEVSMDGSKEACFKYLGNDPFTGTIHYQCSECKSYLNVDPMHILKIDPARGQLSLGQPGTNTDSVSVNTDFLLQLPGMIKDGVLGLTRYIRRSLGFSF